MTAIPPVSDRADVPRRGSHRALRWLAAAGLALLLLLACAAAAGAVYQVIATRRDATRYPPPGALIDVDGHRLHLLCTGHGSPAVILDGPAGASHLVWTRVQPGVAAFTTVCSYDRAGFGWSERGTGQRTSTRMAAEFHELLRRADIPGPYVVVGNSLGGVNVRSFALQFPGDVAGMVLLDAGHEDQFRRLPPGSGVSASERRMIRVMQAASRLGILRLAGVALGEGSTDLLPDSQRPAAWAMGLRTAWVDAVHDEVFQAESGYAEAGVALARGPRPLLGDKPLLVLTRDTGDAQFTGNPALRDAWMALQRDLAAASTQGAMRVVPGSGHFVEVDRPEAVIAAVREVVDAVRGRHAAQ